MSAPRIQFERLTQWPAGHVRTPPAERTTSRFRSGYADTLELLERELRLLGAENAVLQVDVAEAKIRNDGLLYSNARVGAEDSGIVLSFETDDGRYMYPCDSYRDWKDNLRAIALTLENLRAVDRYGVSQSGEQYVGWRALPADVDQAMTAEDAATVLARSAGAGDGEASELASRVLEDPKERRAVYRRACKYTHPDQGGSEAAFHRVQTAMELLEGLGAGHA